MTVRDFMTEKLITVTPDTPIFDAIDLMKKHDIHRLPVMEDQKLVGLITQGVIQESMPSKATSLSVFELNYLINKTKVGDVMLTNVTTIEADALLEDAIKVEKDIVLLEGNWLLLDEEPWTSLRQWADDTILILAEEETLKERLIGRKEKGGLTREEAEAWYENSDSVNVRRVLASSVKGNLIMKVEKDNDYQIVQDTGK